MSRVELAQVQLELAELGARSMSRGVAVIRRCGVELSLWFPPYRGHSTANFLKIYTAIE